MIETTAVSLVTTAPWSLLQSRRDYSKLRAVASDSPAVRSSQFAVRSSQFAVRSSQFAVRSSQFAVRSSQNYDALVNRVKYPIAYNPHFYQYYSKIGKTFPREIRNIPAWYKSAINELHFKSAGLLFKSTGFPFTRKTELKRETPPTNPGELSKFFFTKRKKDVLDFDFGDSGKTAFFAVQVENEGKKGPWGALVFALIP